MPSLAARAQPAGWPSRPIRIIVPFGLGGAADVAARYVAEPLSQALGVPVVIENRPGAGGTIGTDLAAKAAPDGHTLVALGNTAAVNETLQPQRGYVLMRDLTVVAPINIANNVLVVHPSVPAANLGEFLALLRREPGRWNYAHSGPGTPYHLAGEMLKTMAGVDMVAVSFRGSNEARTAVISGQVPIMFDGIPTMIPQIQAGRVRGIATTALTRDRALPELPAVAEAVPGFQYPIWIGLMTAAATPRPIVERLHAEITRIMSSEAGTSAMRRMGAEPMVMTLAEFDAYLRNDVTTLADLVRRANLRAE
ncbi:MAG: tripartite tricarboxylate transporter substrate binding protein [Rubritepida sp.]|nr:tripartite tricarboxylate transporter substrate binding protein [Rubritepida sp.]MCU0945592.1 tripartite tricarboxylate transporter substrate binding protein [Rubritepida sp.]